MNERLLERAGFALLEVADLTQAAAQVALRWHDALARHREALTRREG